MLLRVAFAGVLIAAAAGAQQPGPTPGRAMGGARFLGGQPGMPGRVVKNAPFSAELVTETSQTLADGNRIKQTNTVRMYRDSEGRTRREQALNNLGGLAPNSNLPQVVFIHDPVAGTDLALNPSNRTATRSVRPQRGDGPSPRMAGGQSRGPNPMMRGNNPAPDATGNNTGPQPRDMRRNNRNIKSEALGRQVIEGVQADGTRTTMTIPAGEIGNEQPIQIVSERWYSPDLQMVVLSKRSDPRSGETVVRMTNLSRAEPPRTMFDVPADYKVSDAPRGRGFGGPGGPRN
jgi:hypothetical protein